MPVTLEQLKALTAGGAIYLYARYDHNTTGQGNMNGLFALHPQGFMVLVETISGTPDGDILGVWISGRLDFWYADWPEGSEHYVLTRRVED